MKNAILLIVAGFAIWMFWPKPDVFELHVYPDVNNLTVSTYKGRFKTADDARIVASSWMQEHPGGDYEIGKNPKESSGFITVYEDSFR